jgi:hypothetical protein
MRWMAGVFNRQFALRALAAARCLNNRPLVDDLGWNTAGGMLRLIVN